MTVPTAVASGKDAETPTAISPRRAGLHLGALAALLLFAVFLVAPPPDRILALAGLPREGLERFGGMEMVWVPPPGADVGAIEAVLASRQHGARVRRAEGALVLSVPFVAPEAIDELARRIAGEGLAFHVVVATEAMRELATVLALPMHGATPVDLEIDQWRPEGGGEVHVDYFLVGARREDLEAAAARAAERGWALPAGTRLAYERSETATGVRWRSYVIASVPELDGARIADAVGSYDPYSNRPIVLLDFDVEGARAFGALTARIAGDKLAIVVGDEVRSAPIINGEIRGGRASITMGGADPRQQELERDLLVAALRTGPLPPGGTVRDARYVAPATSPVRTWLVRVALALGGGGLVGLLGWALVRRVRPSRRRALPRLAGRVPWMRLAVVPLAGVVVVALPYVPALGLSPDALDDRMVEAHAGMLGLTPVLLAYIVVELFALAVPTWRRRRHAGPEARAPLSHAVVAVAFVFAVLQAWPIAQLFGSIDLLPPGVLPRVLFVGSLVAGTLVYVITAEVIRRRGLGNGYAALLVAGWLVAAIRATDVDPRIGEATLGHLDLAVGLAAAVAAGLVVATVLRWRIARVGELPVRPLTSGVAPLGHVMGYAVVAGVLGAYALSLPDAWTIWIVGLAHRPELALGLVVVLAVAWSCAFTRPALILPYAARVGLAPPAWASWAAAVALTLGALVVVTLVEHLLFATRPPAAQVAAPLVVVIASAWLLDVIDGLRCRRGELVRVWSLHDADHVELVVHALGEAEVPYHLAGANLRLALGWFGPFAPIDVFVPVGHASEARARLVPLFRPA